MTGREFWRRYIAVRVCAGCRELISYRQGEDAFCPKCRAAFDRAKTESCPSCFQSYCECICMPKDLQKAGVLSLRKLVRYSTNRQNEPQNRIIYSLKHKPNRRYSAFLAGELYPLVDEELRKLGVDDPKEEVCLVPIPRGRRSYMKYGTDQSESVCRALSELCGIPHARVIGRRWGGREQKKLTVSERRENLQGLLFVTDPDRVRGKVVVLLDDVVTTGASMVSCARLLKKAGAAAILSVCVAKNS